MGICVNRYILRQLGATLAESISEAAERLGAFAWPDIIISYFQNSKQQFGINLTSYDIRQCNRLGFNIGSIKAEAQRKQ
jgi:hypothetical protein